MHVMTVTGPIDRKRWESRLPHEHLLLDMDWPGLWPDVSHRPDLCGRRWASRTSARYAATTWP